MRAVDAKEHDLQRKKFVPSEHRTDERDRAADWFEQEILEKNRWPMHLVDLEREAEWSRQHIKNVIDNYFEPVRETPSSGQSITQTKTVNGEDFSLDINIPGDVDPEPYLRGYISGFIDAVHRNQV